MCWDRHASVTRERSPTVRWLLVIIILAVHRWGIESAWGRAGVKAAQQRAQVCFLTPAMAERVRAEPRVCQRSFLQLCLFNRNIGMLWFWSHLLSCSSFCTFTFSQFLSEELLSRSPVWFSRAFSHRRETEKPGNLHVRSANLRLDDPHCQQMLSCSS